MTTSATLIETKTALTQDDVIALAQKAREDEGAFDEMMAVLVRECGARSAAERRAESLERQVTQLERRLRVLLERMFGRKSEKIDPAQLKLFLDELAGTAAPAAEQSEETETVTFQRRKGKGHGRQTFPANLPRQKAIVLEVPQDQCHCEECDVALKEIFTETTERGHFVPGYWVVNVYQRPVMACPKGCGRIAMAPLPPALVEKARFEPSVAVDAAVGKFLDNVPLERKCSMHARLGVEVPPTTLGDNVAALAELHEATVAQMESEILAQGYLHADDTKVVALVDADKLKDKSQAKNAVRADGTTKRKLRIQAHLWAYVALDGKVFYRFTEDWRRDNPGGPAAVLEGFQGWLISDAYAGFEKIGKRPGIKRGGCWAHCRRGFKDALNEDPKRAARVILMIGRIYWIEAAVKKRRASGRSLSPEEHLAIRRRRSARQVDKIVAYAKSIQGAVLPRSGMGEAIGYLLKNEATLRGFLEDSLVPPDNNAAERALRGVATGRKNYLHIGSLDGGRTAAVFYSLIGSCKALGLNPYAYLLDTTETLLRNPETPRAQLTPWAWAAAQAAKLEAEAKSKAAAEAGKP